MSEGGPKAQSLVIKDKEYKSFYDWCQLYVSSFQLSGRCARRGRGRELSECCKLRAASCRLAEASRQGRGVVQKSQEKSQLLTCKRTTIECVLVVFLKRSCWESFAASFVCSRSISKYIPPHQSCAEQIGERKETSRK